MNGHLPFDHDKGWLMIAGHRFWVTSVRLNNAQIEVQAEGSGPFPHAIDGTATLFGRDGRGVGQMANAITLPRIRTGEVLTVNLSLRIGEIRVG